MAWIESHQETGRHPKTKKFARLISASLPQAVGHLQYLWWWALDFAQDGELMPRYEAEDIADAVLWDGDANAFIDALIKSGYADEEDGNITLHDWNIYAGKLLDRRAADRERKRKGSDKNLDRNLKSEGSPTEELQNDNKSIMQSQSNTKESAWNPSVQNSTEQNSTLHNSTEQDSTLQVTELLAENDTQADPEKTHVPFKEIMTLFNKTCFSYRQIQAIEGSRRKAVAARFKFYKDINVFKTLFEKAEVSVFLKGHNNSNWSADFDWLMKASNMTKVLEGKYDNKQNTSAFQQRAAPSGTNSSTLDVLKSIIDAEENIVEVCYD